MSLFGSPAAISPSTSCSRWVSSAVAPHPGGRSAAPAPPSGPAAPRPARRGPHAAEELVRLRVLEQVADRPRVERLEDASLIGERGQDDDAYLAAASRGSGAWPRCRRRPGIERSIRTTSGLLRSPRARSPRRRPRPRRPRRCPRRPRAARSRPARTSAWSSTISTRITSKPRARSRVPRPGSEVDPQRATRIAREVGEHAQAEVAALAVGDVGDEPPAVVLDHQGRGPVACAQRRSAACCAPECATTLRIDSWATRKNSVSSSSGRARSGGTSSTVWDPAGVDAGDHVRKRRAKPGAVQVGWVDLDQEAAKVADALPQPAGRLAHQLSVRAGGLAVTGGRRRKRVGGAGKVLHHAVVEVLRQSADAPSPKHRSPAAAAARARADHGAGGAPATTRAVAAERRAPAARRSAPDRGSTRRVRSPSRRTRSECRSRRAAAAPSGA